MALQWDTPGLTWDSGATWDSATETPSFKLAKHMAQNALPASLDELTSLSEDCADGAQQLEVTIGLMQNKEANIRADLLDLTTKRGAYDALVGLNQSKESAVTTARSNARAGLTAARDRLKQIFGNEPGEAWQAAGWPDNSTAVPATSEKLLPLLNSVKIYLTNNAGQEIPALGVTAANMNTLHTALSNAVSARNLHADTRGTAKDARDASANKMRLRLRGLIGELEQLIDPLSPHWLTFGLKRPGAPDSPDAVTGTQAIPLGGAKLRVKCNAAPRAEYYQIWIQIVGADPELHLVESPTEPDKILENLPVGATVKAQMRAVNETGPGPFGAEVQAVIT